MKKYIVKMMYLAAFRPVRHNNSSFIAACRPYF